MENETRTKYVVYKANIMDDEGNKVLAGEVVALSPKLARHYNKLGFLRPYMDDTPDEMQEEMDAPPVPARSRRFAAVATGNLPAGTAEK